MASPGRRTQEGDPRRPWDPPWRNRVPCRDLWGEDEGLPWLLRDARRRHGWSLRQAAAETRVCFTHLGALERGQRAPSVAVAHAIIKAYELPEAAAERLLAVARPNAGRSSPHRN